jgi:hypothetical protein
VACKRSERFYYFRWNRRLYRIGPNHPEYIELPDKEGTILRARWLNENGSTSLDVEPLGAHELRPRVLDRFIAFDVEL